MNRAHFLNSPYEAADSGKALPERLDTGFAVALLGQEAAKHGDATNDFAHSRCLLGGPSRAIAPSCVSPSHYTHLPPLYPIVLSDEHRERADELGEAGV